VLDRLLQPFAVHFHPAPANQRKAVRSASNCSISPSVNASPSSTTSIWKSSRASWPTFDGALPPILAITRGRAGRFPLHAAGMRTTTPALSSRGTSRNICIASPAVQRSGWKISPASIMLFNHGQSPPARCTGSSSDSRRPF
jgi:hypothetical protein